MAEQGFDFSQIPVIQETEELRKQMKEDMLRDLLFDAALGVTAPLSITRRAAEFAVEKYANILAKKVTQGLGLRGAERTNVYNKLYTNTAKDVAAVPDDVWDLVQQLEIKQTLGGPTARFEPAGKRFPTQGKIQLSLDNLYSPGVVTHEASHARAAYPRDPRTGVKKADYGLARASNYMDNVFLSGGVPEELIPGERMAYGMMDRFRAQGSKFDFHKNYQELLRKTVGQGIESIRTSAAPQAKDLYEALIEMVK